VRPAGAGFTIQVAALSQLTRAEALVEALKSAGHEAYIVKPPDDDPNGLYRVRVGRFASRGAAQKAVPKLEELRGEKLWIIKGQ
jgi:cell division septation protein DedD